MVDTNIELTEKLVSLKRVTKVVEGGRNFSCSVMVVVGDKKGLVGYGMGKAKEASEARIKASKAARKSLVRIPLREGRTIHHDSFGNYGSGKVTIRNAPSGTGIIAGGAMRAVFEAVGIQDVVAKAISNSSPYNLVKATFDALQRTDSPKRIAARRGKKVGEIINRRSSSKSSSDSAVGKEENNEKK